MKLVLISGKIGSGKDTTCGVLTRLIQQQGYTVKSLAFADVLKRAVAYVRREGIELYYSRAGKDSDDGGTRRRLLNAVGKAFNQIDPGIFVRFALQDIREDGSNRSKTVYIITDLRLKEEILGVFDERKPLDDITVIRLIGSFEPCPNPEVANSVIETDLDFLDTIDPRDFRKAYKIELRRPELKDTRPICPDAENNKRDNIYVLTDIVMNDIC